MPGEPWNHNVHYHPLVLDAVPDDCGSALDIGCGDGTLVRKLAAKTRRVTGIDRSRSMIREARKATTDLTNASFVDSDFVDFEAKARDGEYGFICCVASLHHIDFASALTGMARMLAPDGSLVVIGLARHHTPLDWAVDFAAIPAQRVLARRHGGATEPPGMPTQEPTMTWDDVRRTAQVLLPGSRYRRLLLWRYSLTWQKPAATRR
ncbi:class I SAM-dependent methyltransferase [Saccharopolyspora sp. NFXS83]|uniref:class I SAM-dependent methyltransferase n=1 Tax=Saccharopolyspora sp. NFXS83 TaxID=2993560 RepID=UPI00224AFFA8|nr:class I SAM-dependent methyltransferase [Saccharopolyspora sp. NFXS83]MCX2734009.1 class I SAM-dependent methyltransferase [Saccharopolyspora sp. NFXS83]